MGYKDSITEAFDIGYQGISGQGIYKGRIINRYLTFEAKGYYKFDFKIISKNSRNLQAIILLLSKEFTAEFYINGKKVKKPKGRFPKIQLWENDVPEEFSVYVHIEDGELDILNGCALPLSTVSYCIMLSGGCAIFIEKKEDNHYRLNCNDVDLDDDFDDFVFEVKFTEISDEQKWIELAKQKHTN